MTMKFRSKSLIKISCLFLFVFLFQVLLSYIVIQQTALADVKHFLETLNERVRHDLRYENGKWDTAAYNSDPFTAYPNSSSAYPLYIVTSDGFVIERSKPIHGLLDASDYKHLMNFQTPQMINTITNEQWRVFSEPILRNGQTYGVILVSSYNPDPTQLEKLDQQLRESAQRLNSTIEIKNGELDTSKIDVRNIHYSVSFEVVSRFNKVLANDGRTPSFIDTSYVADQLNKSPYNNVEDTLSEEEFLTYTQPILDSNKQVVGIVVVGRSTQSLERTLQTYLLSSLGVGVLLTIPLSLVLIFLLKDELQIVLAAQEQEQEAANQPRAIRFDKKASAILVNDKKYEIAYASNQYYICKALFSNPKKRWEQDELLEAMGEDFASENSRTVYDASLAINRKVELKLIMYQDKTYFINPHLVDLVKQ